MARVILNHVKKIYEKNVAAVADFQLEIEDKEFIVLVGPSGCGKSTTLRMIAGLEDITDGEIFIGNTLVNDLAPKDRDIAMVFQNYALYPHMTVYENMAFALKLRKVKRAQIDEKVRQVAGILGITDLLQRKPKALSGGQRQRVAIGRAIVREPQVFLMDEPLSNLDAKLRNQMRAELVKLRQNIDTTFVYVTHDQTEAMTLGDRIVVMKDGFIQQIGTPQQVFEQPANMFVAGFIGTPQMNFFDAELRIADRGCFVRICGAEYELTSALQDEIRASSLQPGRVIAGVRPEHIELAEGVSGRTIRGRVDVLEMMGSEIHLHVDIQGQEAVIRVPASELPDSAACKTGRDNHVSFTFAPSRMYLFDQESGLSLGNCM